MRSYDGLVGYSLISYRWLRPIISTSNGEAKQVFYLAAASKYIEQLDHLNQTLSIASGQMGRCWGCGPHRESLVGLLLLLPHVICERGV